METIDGKRARTEQEASPIPRLTEEERRQVLVAWNETTAPYPDRCVHQLVEEQVARSPDAVALVFRGASITYGELDARASALARRLRALGVGPDVLVGIFVRRSIEMVVGLLGILKAGGAYVPLDPSYPGKRLAWMVEDAKPRVIVTQMRLVASLPPHGAQVVTLDADLGPIPAETEAPAVGPEHLAYVMFTSGSTGRPKGVMVRHRSVANLFAAMDAHLSGERPGVWLALTTLSFDISVLELLWTLARGFRVVVQEEAGQAALLERARPGGMAFSLFYFAADAGDATSNKYRLLLEGARFADEHGFLAVWTPERHFHAFGGLYPNPSVTGAAVAATTKRVQIRAGSIVLPLHDPIRVAEEWSVVDNLSGGRVGLSFASGWHADDFAFFPDRYEIRREAMDHGIETVRTLWRGEEVRAWSGTGEAIQVRIFPAPIQKDPPIWISSSGNPETFEMAGRIGANVLTNMLGQGMNELRAKIARYRAARRAAGHEGDGHVTLMLHTFVGTDLNAVREKVRGPFTEYLRTSTDLVRKGRWEFPSFQQPGKERAGDAARAADATELTPEEIDAMMAHAFERYFGQSGLFGTPETCLPRVEALREIGVDELACLIDFGVDTDSVLEALVHLDRLRAACTRGAEDGWDAWDIPAQIRRHGVTHVQCTPSLARVLASSEDALAALAPLRKLLVGGEALPPVLARQLAEVVQGEVLNVYGPTETTVWSTASRVERGVERITVGRPIANTELYVLGEGGEPVAIGAVGELFIGGAGVARGYLGRPDLTAERFVTSAFSADAGARLYRTGDLARYLPSGEVELLGRADHQVKIRGHRVELGEIEATLDTHPAVGESAAAVREDTPGDKRIVAYVVPRAGASDGLAATLRAHLRERLPEAMVPSAVVIQARLPRTPSGKLDRAALPAPSFGARTLGPTAVPANDVEEKIAGVWQELLNLDPIGVNDNFFDLGANSLLMMQSTAKLATALGKSLSLVELLRFTTVRSLATYLGEAKDAAPAEKEALDRARTREGAMQRRRELRRSLG